MRGSAGAALAAPGAMAPAVPLADANKKKTNPFVKPSDKAKANGAATPPRPPSQGNPFITPADKARVARPAEVAANGSAGKPPVNPFPRPAAKAGAAAAPATASAAAAPAAGVAIGRAAKAAAPAWVPSTPVGREAKAAVERLAATGAAEAPAALAADLQVRPSSIVRPKGASLRFAVRTGAPPSPPVSASPWPYRSTHGCMSAGGGPARATAGGRGGPSVAIDARGCAAGAARAGRGRWAGRRAAPAARAAHAAGAAGRQGAALPHMEFLW